MSRTRPYQLPWAAVIALLALLVLLPMARASATTPTSSVSAVSSTAPPAVVPDIPYGPADSPALVLDAYPADAATLAPVVIAIHGGGWRGGDKQTFTPLARGLAAAGYVVFNINYSLDGSLGPAYPREVNDVTAALHWVQAHAAEYGGDAERIGVLGGSAGAHLAAMLGVTANTAAEQPVQAVVTLSGPFDLPPLREVIRLFEEDANECPAGDTCFTPTAGSPDGLIALLGCDPLTCPVSVMEAASPITYVTQYSPPFYIANSSNESVPADQSTLMADTLREAGVPVEVKIIPGKQHSIQYLPDVAQPVLSFFQQYLTAATPSASQAPSATATMPPTGVAETPVDEPRNGGRIWRWLVIGIAVVAICIGLAARRTRAPRA